MHLPVRGEDRPLPGSRGLPPIQTVCDGSVTGCSACPHEHAEGDPSHVPRVPPPGPHIDSASVRARDSTATAPDVYLLSSHHPVDVSWSPADPCQTAAEGVTTAPQTR